jgi:hypothetical protein
VGSLKPRISNLLREFRGSTEIGLLRRILSSSNHSRNPLARMEASTLMTSAVQHRRPIAQFIPQLFELFWNGPHEITLIRQYHEVWPLHGCNAIKAECPPQQLPLPGDRKLTILIPEESLTETSTGPAQISISRKRTKASITTGSLLSKQDFRYSWTQRAC